jgi:hypothetical protein
MDKGRAFEPHRITKPFQLLATWLLGLIVVDGSFLGAACYVAKPDWVPGALVIASIVNVPLFLFSIFLLQTRFRPEMQEDGYYSKYLESKTANTKREIAAESIASLREDIASLEKVVAEKVLDGMGEAELRKAGWASVTVGLNKTLDNFSKIAKVLAQRGIPVHETFGGGAGRPPAFSVAIGRGFDVGQIRSIVDALLEVTDGWISYAEDETEVDQYDHQVLIGAYGDHENGIELTKLKPLLQREGITENEVYKLLGK